MEEITSLGAVSQARVITSNSQPTLWDTGQYFLGGSADATDVTISYKFNISLALAPGIGPVNPTILNFRLEVLDSRNTHLYNIFQSSPITDPIILYSGQPIPFAGTKTFFLPAGAKVVAYMTATQNKDFTKFTYGNDGELTADYSFRKEPTFIKAFDWFDLYSRLISKITDGKYTGLSSLLKQDGFKVAITSVDAIRLFEDALVKVVWKDFWEFINTVFDAALYVVGNTVYLEEKENSIDWDDFVDIGEISEVKITAATDFLNSSYKIGYENEKYDNVNGREEFNTTQEYKSPITKIVKSLDFVGAIRADCYGSEFLRITLSGKPTTDNIADNNLFAFHIKDTPEIITIIPSPLPNASFELAHKLDRTLNAYATGLITPETVFNLKLSPKQCFYRKENFIKSCHYWQDGKTITYQTSDKNADVIVSVPGQRIVEERANVLIGDLDHRYFLPVMVEGSAEAPANFIQEIEANPKKTIRFTINGFPYKGLPMKTGSEPESNKDQVFQMLFGPGTDFSNLVDYFG